jgi:hypothetical protein
MRVIGVRRGMAFTAVCMGTALAAPASAMALSTHSATTTTLNSAGQLVATATCGAGEHVVSGGFLGPDASAAVSSRAVNGDSWTVRLFPGIGNKLTTYAYCARNGQLSISAHENRVPAVTGGANTTANASCASGQTLVAGGYAFLPGLRESNSPTYRDYASAHTWSVMSVFAGGTGKLAAFAYCARGVVVKVRSNSSPSIPTGGDGSATASCHSGETLLSGGYTTTPTPDWHNMTGPDFFYGDSYRSGQRSWTARAHNYSNVAGQITAFAYCMP